MVMPMKLWTWAKCPFVFDAATNAADSVPAVPSDCSVT